MNRLLDANPNDPLGLLARGELLLDDGKLKEAIADFKDGREEQPAATRSSRCCARSSTSRTPNCSAHDFAAGRAVPQGVRGAVRGRRADGDDAAEDKVRREDETEAPQAAVPVPAGPRAARRQGRLGEAFDHYLALANLGEGKQLLDMPDEPNVRMRPDVWARGRIEAMIRRAADPRRARSRSRTASTRSGRRSRTATT